MMRAAKSLPPPPWGEALQEGHQRSLAETARG
jgi:hypothetical protein